MTFLALAIDDWPAAAVTIAGIAFVTIVVSVLIWQIFATGRGAIASEGGETRAKLWPPFSERNALATVPASSR